MAFYGSYNSGVPTHQYYTLSLVNPPKSDNTDQFPVNYRETRNQPFLADPQSYYASVVRFNCTTPLLPILVPAMKDLTSGETEYSISFHHPAVFGGAVYRQQVYFQSASPYQPNSLNLENSEYYYVYQPIQFINMVNTAFAAGWEAWLGASTFVSKGDAPFINWKEDTSVGELWALDQCFTPRKDAAFPTYTVGVLEPVTSATLVNGKIVIVLTNAGAGAKFQRGDYLDTLGSVQTGVQILNVNGDTLTLDTATGAGAITGIKDNTPICIYMNASLYNLFSSFSAQNESSLNNASPPLGTHWKLIFQPTYEPPATWPAASGGMPVYGTVARPSPANGMLYITQQYSTIPLWNPVSSFVFITSILPINPESISAPYTAGSTLSNSGNNSAVGTVLTDFEIPLDKGWETKPTISYAPNAEYRLVDMNGNSNLNNIQISIGWRNKIGVFIPLNIGPNGFAQIKLLFRKRDFNGI